MKVLVVFAHPDYTEKSFNHAIFKTVVKALEESGNEVKISNLYKMNFLKHIDVTTFDADPQQVDFQTGYRSGKFSKEVLEEQEKIEWCTHLICIGPIYWGTLPTAFHAWYSRVFAVGKAYNMKHMFGNGFYKDKKLLIITTTGGPKASYSKDSPSGTLEFRLYPLTFGQMWFCGIKPLRTLGVFGVQSASHEQHKDWLEKIAIIVKRLDEREYIDFYPQDAYNEHGELKDKSMKPNWDRISEQGDLTIDEAIAKLK